MAQKKKKDNDARRSITDKNRTAKRLKQERRQARLIARTQSLIGQHVAVRTKDHLKPLVGTVLEVVNKNHEQYPHEARRHVGSYLKVRTVIGDTLVSRHRTKIIKEQ